MIGVIIATIFCVFVISFPWETHVFFKGYFKRKPFKYYLRMLIYTLIVGAVGTATWFACYFLPSEGIGFFIVKILICCTLPNVLLLLTSFKTSEFKWCKDKFFSLIRRKKAVTEQPTNEEK